jgi:hypothetical protein
MGWVARGVGLVLLGAGSLLVVGAPSAWPVHACSDPEPPWVDSFLGVSSFDRLPDLLEVPGNLATFAQVLYRRDTDQVVRLVSVSAEGWLRRVEEPLPAGIRVDSGGPLQAVVADVIDETPPSAPGIREGRVSRGTSDRGCGPSCGSGPSLGVDFDHAVDDFTPQERMTYVLLYAETEAALLAMSVHEGDWLAPHGIGYVFAKITSDMARGPVWVALQAVDQAGNVSPRTEPLQLQR